MGHALAPCQTQAGASYTDAAWTQYVVFLVLVLVLQDAHQLAGSVGKKLSHVLLTRSGITPSRLNQTFTNEAGWPPPPPSELIRGHQVSPALQWSIIGLSHCPAPPRPALALPR